MKKLFALLLAVIMVLGLVACAKTPAETNPTTTNKPADSTPTEPEVKVEFPLEEEVTLVMTTAVKATVTNMQKNLADNKLWKDLYERTNVRIEVKDCDNIDTLNSLMNAGSYGDIIVVKGMSGINEKTLSDLINSDRLMPITEYVTNRNIMPNFNERVLDVEPYAQGAFVSPDGEIYVMGIHNEDDSQYLENCLWVNKTWVEAAGMTIEDLSTLAGFEQFFEWVKNNDANGDGDPDDEVPYLCYQNAGGFLESFLGCFGVPTKDQTNEGYITLVDGEVVFVPLTQNWVDWMTLMKKWWDAGYFYEDYLLGHDGTGKPLYEYYSNRFTRDNGEPERVGMYAGSAVLARNKGSKLPEGTEMCEYVTILPPKVEGYETRWYMHPGYMGEKGYFAISATCKNPEIALAWMDQCYSQEFKIRYSLGDVGTEWVIEDENGKLSAASVPNDRQAELLETTENALKQIMNFPTATTMKDYEEKLLWTDANQQKADALEQYKDVINTEVWPRPYYDREQSEALSEIFGDVALVIKEYRAGVLNGDKNLTTDYEAFKDLLKQARVEELVEIMQEAYDVFQGMTKE